MPAFWTLIPLQLLIAFPFCVWGGYFFDWTLAAALSGRLPRTPPRR